MSPKASVITLLLALVLSLATAQTARSQTYTWNLDANGSWNTAGNWNPAVVPDAQGVTAVLGNVITADRTVTLSSSVSLGTLSFAGATHSYTVSGNSSTFLNLDNGGSPALITMPASVAAHQYIDAPLAAVSDLIVTNDTSSSNLLIRGGINLGSRTMTFNGSGTVTIGSTFGITGSNGLVVLDGPGQVLLEANNTGVKYVVNAGTLVVESNNAMSPSSFVADLVTINNNAT
ncbi:MAG TPA: hypothetical protein VLM40_20755, partial [Gemmata sp.]|nr:hypothetical protein [Gemmata sp.]